MSIHFLAALAIFSSLPTASWASLLVGDERHSANGAVLQSEILLGFAGTDSVFPVGCASTVDFTCASKSLIAAPDFFDPGDTAATEPAMATRTPASGDGIAMGTVQTQIMFGAEGTGLDRMAFGSFLGPLNLSALSALNFAGNPADAGVKAKGVVTFFLDAGFGTSPTTGLPTVPDELIGHLVLDAPGMLEEHEIVRSITVTKNPMTRPEILASLAAGDPGTSVPLRVGSRYLIEYNYGAEVPHGIDPNFAFRLSASTLLIPEPPGLLNSSLGVVLGLMWWRRTRQRVEFGGLRVES